MKKRQRDFEKLLDSIRVSGKPLTELQKPLITIAFLEYGNFMKKN